MTEDTKKLLEELQKRFHDEQSATGWFETFLWPDGRFCGHCGSRWTREVPSARPAPWWCVDCRRYFTLQTGTLLAGTRMPFRKWAVAIHLELFSEEFISIEMLHRAIGVTRQTAQRMLRRIRKTFTVDSSDRILMSRKIWPSEHVPDLTDPRRLIFAPHLETERQQISDELAARYRSRRDRRRRLT